MADVEPYASQRLVMEKGAAWVRCDLFRYPHHGAQAIDPALATAVHPRITVVTSNGRVERPGKTTARRLTGITWFTEGRTLRLTTDGVACRVENIWK